MDTIKNYITQYLKWREENIQQDVADRESRVKWYQEKFGGPNRIHSFTEKDLHELIEKLWALEFWRNKEYKVNSLIKDNGIEKLKAAFINLLYSDKPIAVRWDTFRNSIKGFGPSSLSEILTLVYPDRYGILNSKPLTVLPLISFLSEQDVKKISYGYTSGKDYEKFMIALENVRQELINNGLKDADFINVDFFIWYLYIYVFKLKYKREKKTRVTLPPVILESINKIEKITSHTEAEFVLLSLGRISGYDTFSPDRSKEAFNQKLDNLVSLNAIPQFTTPTLLDTIKNIDVIWFDGEFPVCCFEVEHTTGVTSGLLRLYQTSQLYATKLFIIAPQDVIKKFDTEMNKMPFSKMKDQYIFRSYDDLISLYNLAERYFEVRKKFF